MAKFKVGDKVRFIGDCDDHLNSKELKKIYENKTVLEISYVHKNNTYDVRHGIWNFEEYELEFATPSINHPMDIVTQQVLADIKMPNYINVPKYEGYISDLTSQIMGIEDRNKFYNVKGEDKMKILEIYSRKANSVIEDKYDELEKEVRENDSVNKIIQDASNQINVLLDRDEKNAINLVPTGIYSELLEPKSSEKIVELKREREREERNVEKLIEEVKARLEICDDNETSKVAVLKEYGILDKDGRIAEYKIEKKGRK